MFDPFHIELRGGHVGSRVLVERHQFVQGPVANHHARRMGRGVAQQAFDLLAIVQKSRHDLFRFGLFAQLRLIGQGFFDADRFNALDGDQLREPIDLAVRHLQHPPDIAHSSFRQKRAEGDDLADFVAAVFLLHIADHFLAPVHTKIDVEIGHRDPFGVQEPLKQQTVAERIEIGDHQRISHQRARTRATTGAHGDIIVFGVFDEIGHDQEIAREAHAFDDA